MLLVSLFAVLIWVVGDDSVVNSCDFVGNFGVWVAEATNLING